MSDFRPEVITFSEIFSPELIYIIKLGKYAALTYPANFEWNLIFYLN